LKTARSASTRAVLAVVLAAVALLVAASSASAAVVIIEIESGDPGAGASGDYVELTNNGTDPIDITGWKIKDDEDTHVFTIPAATTLDPGAYYVAFVNTGGADANVLKGGAGNDAINARNHKKEKIDCGPGRKDVAAVDKADKVKGCEKVMRARR
jgi:hypothetical protein